MNHDHQCAYIVYIYRDKSLKTMLHSWFVFSMDYLKSMNWGYYVFASINDKKFKKMIVFISFFLSQKRKTYKNY